MHKTTEDGSHRRAHAKVSYVYACVLSATAATQGNKATREGEWSCLETKGKFRALLVGLGLGLGLLGPALLSGWALAGPTWFELSAGDVILMDPHTWHCGGANTSEHRRTLLSWSFEEAPTPGGVGGDTGNELRLGDLLPDR